MAIYELDGKREFELINNFNLAKLIKQKEGFYPLNKEKEIKGKKVLYPIAKSNHRDVVLKRGQQVVFYDKEVENPKDISEVIDFEGRIYVIEGLSIQRQVVSGKLYEFGIIMLRYFKEARKADEIKKDNYILKVLEIDNKRIDKVRVILPKDKGVTDGNTENW